MLRDFLAMLGEPDNFKGDPYGYSTNQIGHATLIGFGGCCLLAWLVVNATGEWLDQRLIFAAVLSAFAFGWEWSLQGWRGWDSFEDSAFVGIGASGFLTIDMMHVIDQVMTVYILILMALLPGILRRARQSQDDGRG